MANYLVLQENDESKAYAFKVLFDGYKPEMAKVQREQYTVTGALDVQVGPTHKTYLYTLKMFQLETGTFSVVAGATMTATTVYWGSLIDLRALFARNVPPTNKFRYRDVNGDECYVFFSGKMVEKILTNEVVGEGAYVFVDIMMLESSS